MIFNIDNICNFKVLIGKIDINERINVVCTSLFKMKNGYKRFDKYILGLEFFFREFFNYHPDFKFMLFIDNSVIENNEVYDRITKLDNTKLILIKYIYHDKKDYLHYLLNI